MNDKALLKHAWARHQHWYSLGLRDWGDRVWFAAVGIVARRAAMFHSWLLDHGV